MTPKALSAEHPVVAAENHWRDVADKYLAEMADLRAHIAALEKERDAALADNATIVEKARTCGPAIAWALGVGREFRTGAALLERHEKALVRARNEGRKQAFNVAEACRAERRTLRDGIDETEANAQRIGWLACKESEAERIAVAITRLMEEPEQ